jgi:hypothetical protein
MQTQSASYWMLAKYKGMKVKEVIKLIEQDGWFMIRNSVLKQAGLKHGMKKSV